MTDWIELLMQESDTWKDREWFDEQVNNPNWKEKGRVHNWRNYISDSIKKSWHSIPIEAKYVFVIMGEEKSSNEDWD